jgi:hypothetical protein
MYTQGSSGNWSKYDNGSWDLVDTIRETTSATELPGEIIRRQSKMPRVVGTMQTQGLGTLSPQRRAQVPAKYAARAGPFSISSQRGQLETALPEPS